MSERAIDTMSFEEALRELEAIVTRLDEGKVELAESIALYERGETLKKHCDRKLGEAEARVQAITLDAEGNPKGVQPFEAR